MAKLYSITIAAGLAAGNVRLAVNGHISELPRGERINVTEEQKEALDNSREEYALWGETDGDAADAAPVLTEEEQSGRPDLVDKSGDGGETGASDAGGSGDADSEPWKPSPDLVKWQADDGEAGKLAGESVTNDDLRLIASREGAAIESDDNKESLQRKIMAHRAAQG